MPNVGLVHKRAHQYFGKIRLLQKEVAGIDPGTLPHRQGINFARKRRANFELAQNIVSGGIGRLRLRALRLHASDFWP